LGVAAGEDVRLVGRVGLKRKVLGVGRNTEHQCAMGPVEQGQEFRSVNKFSSPTVHLVRFRNSFSLHCRVEYKSIIPKPMHPP
jgi:hypothetical protein